MRVALIHDWLNGMRGGERCLQAFLCLYPEADIFTLFHQPGTTSPEIDARVKKVSFLQRIPGAKRWYRHLLPLYPAAVRRFDLRGYDLIISLSHAAAKNINVPKGSLHICYCFTPMRYIWDQAEAYLGSKRGLFWPFIERMREWDQKSSRGVHQFVAISHFIAARIRCFYGRDADVIYPPVDARWLNDRVATRELRAQPGEAFLYAGALVPYKRVDAVISAFSALNLPLWIVGSGPEEMRLRELAGPSVTFLGHVTDAELADRYRRCRALVFAGTEDFGMMPIECMAAGRPVIGLWSGGLKESIRMVKPWRYVNSDFEDATGVAIKKDQHSLEERIIESVMFFMQHESRFSDRACKRQAALFGPQRFFEDWQRLADRFGIDAGKKQELDSAAYA